MKNLVLFIVAGLLSMAGTAYAAVPAAVTDAITAAGTDAETVAVAVFVVLVGIFAIKLLRKAT